MQESNQISKNLKKETLVKKIDNNISQEVVVGSKKNLIFWIIWFIVHLQFFFVVGSLLGLASINVNEKCSNSGLVWFCGIDTIIAQIYLFFFVLLDVVIFRRKQNNKYILAYIMLVILFLMTLFVLFIFMGSETKVIDLLTPVVFFLFCLIYYPKALYIKSKRNYLMLSIIVLGLYIIFLPKQSDFTASHIDHIDWKTWPGQYYYYEESERCSCFGVQGKYTQVSEDNSKKDCYGIVYSCKKDSRIYERKMYKEQVNSVIKNGIATYKRIGLTEVPSEVLENSSITNLIISENKITNLPSQIGNLSNLEELYLTGNNLTILPPEIGQLKKLERLYIDNNNLTTLPPEIGQLVNLDTLILNGNNLTTLPPEIGQLKKLRVFEVGGNQITQLPSEIGKLDNLWSFIISGNYLKSLPIEMSNLTNMERLYIRQKQGNPIVPDLVRNLPKLHIDE